MKELLALIAAAAAAALLWPFRADRRLSANATHERPETRRDGIGGWLRARHSAVAVAASDIPLVLDLLAVCLAAGSTPAAALAVVGRAVPGPLGDDLCTVARGLGLGSTSGQAWAPVLAGRPQSLQRAADRFAHAERSGAALAPALAALAEEQRRVVQLARARAARRVGVLAVAPLGLCFLPAFILTGVLPIVVGLVARLSLS